MIKLFTMVKDEVDIVEDWLQYHGNIFGFTNLHIIDNMSTDGTFEILGKYAQLKGIFVYRHDDYKKKGDLMKQLISQNKTIIAFPLDIDEFIVYYNPKTNKITINDIVPYLNENIIASKNDGVIMNTHTKGLYKCDYIHSKITKKNKNGFDHAVLEATRGRYDEKRDKIMTKSFFDTRFWKGNIDHGNHCNFNNHFSMSKLCLVHYHKRNFEQHKKKVINNVKGLGYNANNLEELEKLGSCCAGAHHVINMIKILKGNYSFFPNEPELDTDIDLRPISTFLKNIYKK